MLEPLIAALAISLAALTIDAAVGEPPNRLHPVVWIGTAVGWLEGRVRRGEARRERMAGTLLVAAVVSATFLTTLLALGLVREFLGTLAWVLVTAIALKTSFAIFSLRRHVRPIREALANGDLEGARKGAAMLVSREVGALDEAHVRSAVVESVSENAVDSAYSPMFYNGLGGVPLALAFRSVNVMDAMIGYMRPSHVNVGRCAARLDDRASWLTARISPPFIALAALITGRDWRGAMRVARKQHAATPSPNSGYSMCAVAGALGVGMEKPGCYLIGEAPLPGTNECVAEGLMLVELSAILFLLLVSIPLYVFIGIHVQVYLEDALLAFLRGLL